MPRRDDIVKLDLVSTTGQNLSLDNFTSFEITNDITSPAEASFEIGNDGTWEQIKEFVQPGTRYKVFLNGQLRLAGRIELNDIPLDALAGSVVRFTVRSVLSDAMFNSARQQTRVKNRSLIDFIREVYAPLSVDFLTDQDLSRNLMTGKGFQNQGNQPRKIERVKVQEARVKPPESIYSAVDRHLRRFGLMHWDAPDGKIVIGAPNDEQDPIYTFNAFRDPQKISRNNILAFTRAFDVSGVPTAVGVFGVGGKRNFTKAKVAAFAQHDDLAELGFYRPITIIAEGIKTQDNAQRAANRELSARSKGKDTFEIEVDGLSYWDGVGQTPYGIDTVCNINSDIAAGGPYYIHRVTLRRDAANGDTTNLTVLRRGIWRL